VLARQADPARGLAADQRGRCQEPRAATDRAWSFPRGSPHRSAARGPA
jgi:hypothetical protein